MIRAGDPTRWRLRAVHELREVETFHSAGAVGGDAQRICVHLPRVCDAASRSTQVRRELKIFRRAFRLNRATHEPLEAERIRAGQHCERQRLGVHGDVELHELLAVCDAARPSHVVRIARSIAMRNVRLREAHVEPRRVQRRRTSGRAVNSRKAGEEILDRSEIEIRHRHVEAVKHRERRLEDVELSASGEPRDRVGDVRVVPCHVRAIDHEMRQRPARPLRVAEEIALPVHRERRAGERPKEIEIDRSAAEIHIAHSEDRPTDDERHRAHQA